MRGPQYANEHPSKHDRGTNTEHDQRHDLHLLKLVVVEAARHGRDDYHKGGVEGDKIDGIEERKAAVEEDNLQQGAGDSGTDEDVGFPRHPKAGFPLYVEGHGRLDDTRHCLEEDVGDGAEAPGEEGEEEREEGG